ncbi:MAG: hypothetical protein E3J94_03830, partial [Desulfobacteraceae bacterium]
EAVSRAITGRPEPITLEPALSLATKLEADYVLLGSLTVFGESISTDARFFDVHQKKPVVVFNQFGKDHGDVISHINLFAAKINEKLFGRKTIAYQPPQPTPGKESEKEASDNIRKHPESLWTPESGSGVYVYGALTTESRESFSFWRSRKFKIKIRGMAIGNVDGDNRNETVFINHKTVFIYRHYDKKFEKIGEITGSNYDDFLGVDVADINNNGKSEIFVTNLSSNTEMLDSFVLEWNGAQFGKIKENTKWYYRVLNIQNRGGSLLLGQKKGLDDIFSRSGVYELIWDNGQYEPVQRQNLAKHKTIYGFTYGDVYNDGREMIVVFAHNDHIRILNPDGHEEWRSIDPFGGSTTYIASPYEPDASEPPSERLKEHFYLPQRIHVADLDKDGKNEIIVVKNILSIGRLLTRVKIFKSGHIEALAMDGLGSTLKWKTRKISGYISDYTIADIDNDGQDELVFSVVSKTGSVLGEAKSYLVSQEISK